MEKQPESPIYRILIKGHLDAQWMEWFDGMTITYIEQDTLLSGSIVDQSALQSILSKIGSLNLTLISVNQSESDADNESKQ